MRAVVLRDGKLDVRETADPEPGPGELLIKPLSATICASDVHYMDHPNSADRFKWDSDRDTVMGHEFIGEVVGHGPNCSGDFPVGARVTSLPIMIRPGEEPLVIGHNPDAPGAFGELMLVSEVMARTVPDGVANDFVALVDAFAVGGSTFAAQESNPASCHRSSVRAPSACRRWLRWPRATSARSWSPTTATNGWSTQRRSARRAGQPVIARPVRCVARSVSGERLSDDAGYLRMRRPQRATAGDRRRVRVHGARVRRGRMVRRGHDRLYRGDAQRHDDPVRWRPPAAGLVRHARCGRRGPVGSRAEHRQNHRTRRRPEAIDQVRKGQGPPRVVVHPTAS